jgi:hypothetical protein
MTPDNQSPPVEPGNPRDRDYEPPTMTFLGTLAELTREKDVGASDGSTFLGLDIGS